jgi:hypothetical protein
MPTATVPIRNALAVEGMLTPVPHVEIALGVDLAARASHTGPAGSLTLLDVPTRLALRFVHRLGPVDFGAGPTAALHVFQAQATGLVDGKTESTTSAAPTVGLDVLVRAPLRFRVAGEVRLFFEETLPTTRFWIANTETVTLGPRVGLAAGVVFPSP